MKPAEGTVWQSSIIANFTQHVLFKLVTLNFKSKSENIYNVDMFLGAKNVAEILIKKKYAVYQQQPSGASNSVDMFTSRFIKAANIPLNTAHEQHSHQLEVTCIYSPFCFYAQLSEKKAEFSFFEETLQTYYETSADNVRLTRPQIGQMCIARYSQDQAWYRAIVKEIDADLNSVVVFFIDYGNQETIQMDGNLLVIHEQFVKYPCMGVLCCLDGLAPIIDTSRPESASEECINFM